MGTHWEEGKINKKSLSPPPVPIPHMSIRKKLDCLSVLSLSIGCMKFLFPKLFITVFHLG
jgi:hypothetical protein